jgi:hypothetical protein
MQLSGELPMTDGFSATRSDCCCPNADHKLDYCKKKCWPRKKKNLERKNEFVRYKYFKTSHRMSDQDADGKQTV